MGHGPAPGYGTPNWELIERWVAMEPDADGPFWALNLMRYRDVARYDGAHEGPAQRPVSGREADDAYAPLGPLAAIGARVALLADVVDQPAGEPAWDRVGIVCYPSRSAFFEMQRRDDFKAQHVHKEAGMAFTIVMACLPTGHREASSGVAGPGRLVLVVERGAATTDGPDGGSTVATFAVEGVIVGDERRFDRVRFLELDGDDEDEDLAAHVQAASSADEVHLLVLEPQIDDLVDTIVGASSSGSS